MNLDELSDDVKLAGDESKDRAAIAIRENLSRVESAMTEFDKISAGLADLAARYPVDLVYDVTTTKGMAEAVAHRAAWRDPRINVEKFRKTAKAPVLALGKDIDARAAWLTEQLLTGEEPVDQQIQAELRRKEAEKQARINAEFGRVQAIQDAIGEIHMEATIGAGKSSSQIAERIATMKAETLDPAVFQEMMAQAKATHDAAIVKLELAYKAKLHDEAEAAKLAAEREELAALRAAAAEQKRKDEAAAAEARRVEQEKAQAERAAQQVEQARLNAEAAAARAKADAEAAEQRRQAQIEHDAAMKRQRDELATAQKIADDKAAKARAKQLKAEAAEKKLRDAAPLLLAALKRMLDAFIEDPQDADRTGAEKAARAAIEAAT